MAHSYVIHDHAERHYMTFQVIGWVDIFTRQRYRDIVLDSFNYCRVHKGLELNAYVIMSNHIHLIARAKDGNLGDIIRDLKAHTARQILASVQQEPESRREWMLSVFRFAAGAHARNTHYQLWTHENHVVFMNPMIPDIFTQRLNYIHQNPVRAGLVTNADDYLYSSALNYTRGQGLIEVDVLL